MKSENDWYDDATEYRKQLAAKDAEIERLKAFIKQEELLGEDFARKYKHQAIEIERLNRIIDPHVDKDGNFDTEGFDWKCLEWEAEIKRLKERLRQIEQNGCYTQDETGWICGIAEENIRLKECIKDICKNRCEGDASDKCFGCLTQQKAGE